MSPPIRPIAGSQMAVFLINSRLGLLSAAHNSLKHEPHFSRSYVCILPSSLTRGRSCASDYSSFLRVSVSGTVHGILALDSVSRHLGSARFASTFSPLAHRSARRADFPARLTAPRLRRELPFSRRAPPHASCHRKCREWLNLHSLPIGYGLRPRLRGRLTQGRLPLPWKP